MGKRIYVGNLPWSCTSEQLRELFSSHGDVTSADVINDRDTGRSRGFGFVEMANDDSAQAAMTALNEYELDGRALVVNEARERTPRGGGGRY